MSAANLTGDLDWEDALAAIVAHNAVARAAWADGEYAYLSGGRVFVTRRTLVQDDFSADDWRLLGAVN